MKNDALTMKENGDNNLPTVTSFETKQLDVFQSFLCNTPHEKDKLSNTVELWDNIPKYSISQQAMNGLRTKEGLLPLLKTYENP